MLLSFSWVLLYALPSFQRCYPCIFLSLVLSASSLLIRVLAVAVLLGWICYLVMLYKPAATSHSMHNLEMFTKGVLFYMLCSIHPCPWLHLLPAVACCNLAPKLLNNIAVSLLTLSSVLPCDFLVIHAPYELAIAMLSFITCILTVGYLSMPCNALWWVVQSHQHAYLSLFLPCLNLSYNLPCLNGCYHIFWSFWAHGQ